MRRSTLALVLALACGAGCVTPPAQLAQVPGPQRPQAKAPAPMPISAEQVTAQNARRLTQTLADELDRDANRDAVSASSTAIAVK